MYSNHPDKIVATIEARMTSTRLSGKVMLPLAGKPMLQRIIERLQTSRYIDEIVVATTTNSIDDVLVELAQKCGAHHFRGSEEDVLGRVLGAAQSVQADIIMEITGDNPLLLGSGLVDEGLELFFEKGVDYLGNQRTSFPVGFTIEIFPTAVLAEVDKLTDDPVDREHVSYYIYSHPEKYSLYIWKPARVYSWPGLRITLDEKADYDFIQAIYKRLLPKNNNFSERDVIKLLKTEPDLVEINKHVKQRVPKKR